MYEQLASVSGIVDLSAQEALDRAETFLTQQGYTVVQRAGDSLTVQRRSPDQAAGQDIPNLTVKAVPQPEGGVWVRVVGNDREGVQEQQAAWVEWSESLPKKTEEQATQQGDQQREAETTEASLAPPPTVESSNLPPAPQLPPSYDAPPPPTQGSGMARGTKLAIGGCIVLVLLAVLLGGCVALIASIGPSTDSKSASSESESKSSKEEQKSGSSKEEQPTVAIGQPITVGDVTWRVTNARQANQLSQQDVPKQFADTEQGNFVVVDFDFTNNGNEPATLSTTSLALIDSQGRESEPDSDKFQYIPRDRNIFVLDRINPGVTRPGQAIFTVAPGASGFQLQVGDAKMFSDDNGYVDLGF